MRSIISLASSLAVLAYITSSTAAETPVQSHVTSIPTPTPQPTKRDIAVMVNGNGQADYKNGDGGDTTSFATPVYARALGSPTPGVKRPLATRIKDSCGVYRPYGYLPERGNVYLCNVPNYNKPPVSRGKCTLMTEPGGTRISTRDSASPSDVPTESKTSLELSERAEEVDGDTGPCMKISGFLHRDFFGNNGKSIIQSFGPDLIGNCTVYNTVDCTCTGRMTSSGKAPSCMAVNQCGFNNGNVLRGDAWSAGVLSWRCDQNKTYEQSPEYQKMLKQKESQQTNKYGTNIASYGTTYNDAGVLRTRSFQGTMALCVGVAFVVLWGL